MTTTDIIKTATAIAFHPLTGMIVGALGALALTATIRSFPLESQGTANYLEAIERAVKLAERTGLKGADKALFALDEAERMLADRGIVGNADAVTLDQVRIDIEAAWARLIGKSQAA